MAPQTRSEMFGKMDEITKTFSKDYYW